MALNNRQKQFVIEYLTDFNAHGAAIRAGYSPKTARQIGCENLTKLDIQAAVKSAIDKRSEKTGITAEYVLSSLKSVAERCQQIEPVLDFEGNLTGKYRFEHAGANKALELLGKNLKLFTDKIEVRTIKSVDDLTEEERASLLADLEARLEE